MKKHFKKILCGVVIGVCAILACACSGKNGKKPYDHIVTFNYNLAEFSEEIQKQYADLYVGVKDGSKAIAPGDVESFKDYTIKDYFNEGWYTAKYDENGEVVKTESGKVVLDTKWDFSSNKVTENVTLYANITPNYKLVVKDAATDEEVYSRNGKPGATLIKSLFKPTAPKGYSIVAYYSDKECTQRLNLDDLFPYNYNVSEKVIYGKYIEGNYTVVSTVKDFNTAYGKGESIYVDAESLGTEKVLDFTTEGWKFLPNLIYNGEIAGNGVTFKGISVNVEADQFYKPEFAIFSSLGAKANLHDFTIENAQIEIKYSYVGIKAAFIAGNVSEGAKIKNVTATGVITGVKVDGDISVYKYCVNGNASDVFEDCNISVTSNETIYE